MERQQALQSPEDKEKEELLKKIGEVLRNHGGLESNIPLTHEYWTLLGQYRVHK